jgi:hypothetical protein
MKNSNTTIASSSGGPGVVIKAAPQLDEDNKIRPHPTQALKRFSQTMNETPAGRRFIQINKERVTAFLDKPVLHDQHLKKLIGDDSGNSSKKISDDAKAATIGHLKLQDLPECQKELGIRSRFGDGDGSFFDLWLNSGGAMASKQKYDSGGLPVVRLVRKGNTFARLLTFCVCSKATKRYQQPLMGFKRHYMMRDGDSSVTDDKKFEVILPYEERRRRRLER